ncbi:unnamed protein product [Blumeria hordei]|uniref:Peroxin 11C n=1 Tax=Blumeria hordei TaxID=2867405 RepID=A0A383UT16_BLUHO|nr:unnamed protein product [Blumeria hordei]
MSETPGNNHALPQTEEKDQIQCSKCTPPSSPKSPPLTPQAFPSLARDSLYQTDRAISYASQLLSTSSGRDAMLMAICYSTLLTSSLLSSIFQARLRLKTRNLYKIIRRFSPNIIFILQITKGSSSTLLILSQQLKALSSLISDVRMFSRLWGLFEIWAWAKNSVLNNPHPDSWIRRIEKTQILVNLAYQYLENYAYLSSKGVLGLSTEAQSKAWVYSSRFWVAHILLEFARLWRERGLHEQKAERECDWTSNWRRQVLLNAAYAPLALHWSSPRGLIPEFCVGLLGSGIGLNKVIHLWRNFTL